MVFLEVGDIRDRSLTHKELNIAVTKANHLAAENEELRQLLARAPETRRYDMRLDIDIPGRGGLGIGNRLQHVAAIDANGLLMFAMQAEDAPIVHFGTSWQVRLYGPQQLTVGRQTDMVLGIGTPGLGPGSTAFVAYEQLVPNELFRRWAKLQ